MKIIYMRETIELMGTLPDQAPKIPSIVKASEVKVIGNLAYLLIKE